MKVPDLYSLVLERSRVGVVQLSSQRVMSRIFFSLASIPTLYAVNFLRHASLCSGLTIAMLIHVLVCDAELFFVVHFFPKIF